MSLCVVEKVAMNEDDFGSERNSIDIGFRRSAPSLNFKFQLLFDRAHDPSQLSPAARATWRERFLLDNVG